MKKIQLLNLFIIISAIRWDTSKIQVILLVRFTYKLRGISTSKCFLGSASGADRAMLYLRSFGS